MDMPKEIQQIHVDDIVETLRERNLSLAQICEILELAKDAFLRLPVSKFGNN